MYDGRKQGQEMVVFVAFEELISRNVIPFFNVVFVGRFFFARSLELL